MANNTYTEVHGNLAYLEYEEVSYDLGATWTRTGKKRAGQVVSTDSCECSTLYRWKESSEYICEGTTKYQKLVFQVKMGCDDWKNVEPTMTKKGDIISTNSSDCNTTGDELEPIKPQYRDMESIYCDGSNLVKKTWKELLVNPQSGIWSIVDGSESITILELNSNWCITAQYKTTESEPYCDGMKKYKDIISWISYDNGSTWNETGREKTLISDFSTDCATSFIWKNEGEPYCDGTNLIQSQRRYYKDNDGEEYKDISDDGIRTEIISNDAYQCKDYGCVSGVTVDIISGWEQGGEYNDVFPNVCGFQTISNRDSIGTYKIRIYFKVSGTYRILYKKNSSAYVGQGDPENTLYIGRMDNDLTTSTLSNAVVSTKSNIASYIDYGTGSNNNMHFVDVWFVKRSVDASIATTTDGKAYIGIQKIN